MSSSTPPPAKPTETPANAEQQQREKAQRLDHELDEELEGTFPASDPIPWSHEIK